ncbi:MAG: hypothetical protein CMK59_05310 [Proteobacteria bacterium]|nr:hypothetical protein [Pseudomonadota bacterium]
MGPFILSSADLQRSTIGVFWGIDQLYERQLTFEMVRTYVFDVPDTNGLVLTEWILVKNGKHGLELAIRYRAVSLYAMGIYSPEH